jgi:hypothetical protein
MDIELRKHLRTLTVKLSSRRSSIVLPWRFRFLEPEELPSLGLRELSEAGVRIPERVGTLADASESGNLYSFNIAKEILIRLL